MTTVEILKEMAFTATETQRRALEKAISAISNYDKMQEISLDLAFENDELINKSRWIPVSERLPEDGTWNLFTDGKSISVERYKMDVIDHFFPNGRWFEFKDVIAWQPLPAPYEKGGE